MKWIKTYEKWNTAYKLVSYDDNFEDSNATDFTVTIDGPYGRKDIFVNYEVFLNFITDNDKNLKTYLDNHKELNDFDSIFGDLEELGLNYRDFLQKWIDANIDGITEIIISDEKEKDDDDDSDNNDDYNFFDDED